MIDLSKYIITYDTAVLSNGLLVAYKQIDVPDVIVRTNFLEGMIHEPPEMRGVWHLVEHLLYQEEGADEKLFSLTSRDLPHARTQAESMFVSARLPSRSLESYLAFWGHLVGKTDYDPKEFETEKQIVMTEVGSIKANPLLMKMFEMRRDLIYPGHILGRINTEGPEEVSALTQEQVSQYKAERVNAANVHVIVVGGFEPRMMLESLEQSFGGLPQGIARPWLLRDIPQVNPSRLEYSGQDLQYDSLEVYMQAPGIAHPDNVIFNMMMDYLGKGDYSPWRQAIVHNKRVGGSVDFKTSETVLNTSLCSIIVDNVNPAKTQEAFLRIEHEMERLRQGDIDISRLERQKNSFQKVFWERHYEPLAGKARVISYHVSDHGPYTQEGILEAINTIGPEDLTRVAQSVFNGRYVIFYKHTTR